MEIIRQPTQAQWEGLVAHLPHAPFLQSWAWGEFQAAVGRPPHRLLVADGREPVAAVQSLVHRYPLGFRSLYLPAGPVFATSASADDPALWNLLSTALAALAAESHALFTRIEPQQAMDVSQHLPVRRVISVQPSATHLVDLSKDESALLSAMHPKTRYNLRLAERRGVEVEEGGAELLQDFEMALRQTEQRRGIHFFGPAYFRTFWAVEVLKQSARIYRARLNGNMLAAILVVRYGDTVTYLHGGSSDRGREHMAPHLLQWTAIQRARTSGAAWYDFRGVAPVDAPASHPWAGFSRFKRGFGGVDVVYPGAYDWVRRPWLYSLYRFAQRMM